MAHCLLSYILKVNSLRALLNYRTRPITIKEQLAARLVMKDCYGLQFHPIPIRAFLLLTIEQYFLICSNMAVIPVLDSFSSLGCT